MKKLILMSLYLLNLVFLASCGAGGSNSPSSGGSSGVNNQTGLPNNINGLLVFDTSRPAYGSLGIFSFEINNGSILTETVGKITEGSQGEAPYAYDRNTIVYAKRCDGKKTHYLKIIKGSGLASSFNIATPCTSTLKTRDWNYDTKLPYLPIKVAKLSPDRTKVAIVVELSLDDGDEGYTILVYNVSTGEEVTRYPKYASPEWLLDGRLLLTPNGDDAIEKKGIYITDTELSELTRIDKGEIPTHINSINLDPTGKHLAFSMAGNLWVMDLNGENLRKIVTDKHNLVYPVWSPDGRYIAYLSAASNVESYFLQKISFFDTSTKKSFDFNLKQLTTNEAYLPLQGPLSWVK